MNTFRTLDHADVKGKRVLVRVDLNVPVENGVVSDATRIERAAPSITELADKGAKVILLSHFGRPKGPNQKDSLKPVAAEVAHTIKRPIKFVDDCIGEKAERAVAAMHAGEIICLENTRFHAGEEKNDPEFIAALAKLGDLFVNDAFSVSHRAHASTEGLSHLLPAFAGRTLQAELEAFEKVLDKPARPLVAIVGGAKISTKLDLLANMLGRVSALIIGGAMANTFLAAQGYNVGKSLYEEELLGTAQNILAQAKAKGVTIVLPTDVVVAKEFKAMAPSKTVAVSAVPDDAMILDVGVDSLRNIAAHFESAKTVVWNGPFGAFELAPFDNGTNTAARQVAMLTRIGQLVSVAGGGDTVAALNNAGAADDFTYVSTAGGAFLEWLEGKELPGVTALYI